MGHNRFHSIRLTLPGMVLVLMALLAGCGERNPKDLEEIAPTLTNESADSTLRTSTGASDASAISIANDDCTLDLRQDVVIDPQGSQIRGIFSGKLEKFSSCAKGGKVPVLYFSTPQKFNLESGYGCNMIKGNFNVRCQGPMTQFDDAGRFQVSISVSGDSSKIKARVTYEGVSH